MKKYQSRSPDSTAFAKVNATSSNNFEKGRDRGTAEDGKKFQSHDGSNNHLNFKTNFTLA